MAKKKSLRNTTITEFMTGRYGYDEFSKLLIILSILLMVVTVLLQSYAGMWQLARFMYLIAIIILGFGYYRMGSKKIQKRKAENEKYLRFIAPFSKKAKMKLERDETTKKYVNFEMFTELGEDGETVYKCYRCRKCGVVLRYEAGGGIVKVICPECGTNLVDRL